MLKTAIFPMKKKAINRLFVALLLGTFLVEAGFAQKEPKEKEPKEKVIKEKKKKAADNPEVPEPPPVNTTGNDPSFQYHYEEYDDKYSVSKPWEIAVAPVITILHSSQQERIGGYGNYDSHTIENLKPGFGGMLGACRHWSSENQRWNVGAGLFFSYNAASFTYTHVLYNSHVATDSIHGKVSYGAVTAYLPIMLRWYAKPSKYYLSVGPYFMPALMNLNKTDYFVYKNGTTGSDGKQNIDVPPKNKMSMGLHMGAGIHLGSTLELEFRVNKSLMVVSESPNLGTIALQLILGARF